MAFFTRWISSGGQIIFCFNAPQTLHDSLQTLFLSPSTTPRLSDIYSLHLVVIDDIIDLYDKSVWSLRDIVRMTELVEPSRVRSRKRTTINNHFQNRLDVARQRPNFPLLHDFARHTVHSSETLDVAIDTMGGLLNQHEWFSNAGRSYIDVDLIVSRRTRQHLRFQIQMMRSLKARSKANEARLRNEIDLVSRRAGDLTGSY